MRSFSRTADDAHVSIVCVCVKCKLHDCKPELQDSSFSHKLDDSFTYSLRSSSKCDSSVVVMMHCWWRWRRQQ